MIRSNWILGKPFLKKYFFSFNYEDNVLTYYEIIKNDIIENNNNKIKKIILIVVIVALIIIVSLIGFFLAKFIYNYKKRKATELSEEIVEDKLKNEEDKNIIEPIFENNE